jgi:outer membrane murein-binding lipoprotein Lpp
MDELAGQVETLSAKSEQAAEAARAAASHDGRIGAEA